MVARSVCFYGVVALSWAGAFGCSVEGNDADRMKRPIGTGDGTTIVEDAGTTPSSLHLPCEVDRVLQSKCQSCHGPEPKFGASFSLVTYDDVHAKRGDGEIYERIHERIHDASRPMPPPPNEMLPDDELAILDGWIAAGAPGSPESCASGASDDLGKPLLNCTPDTVVASKTPFVMPKVSDLYVCVGVPLPVQGRRHITAIAPHIDNAKVLHHVLLMQATEPVSEVPYVCTGAEPWKLVSSWAPGAKGLVLPPEAGFPYDSGTRWAIQLHYNNAAGLEGEKDQSGFEFCTTDQLRQYDAGVMAFGSMVFALPPRAKTTVSCDWLVPPTLDGLKIGGMKLIATSPHMHNLGAAMTTTHKPLGGTPKVVVDVQNYSFQNQTFYPTDTDVNPGDLIHTSCTWNNTTDRLVTWGEGTQSEMCYNFTTYYPAIGGEGITSFPWWEPSLGAICTAKSE